MTSNRNVDPQNRIRAAVLAALVGSAGLPAHSQAPVPSGPLPGAPTVAAPTSGPAAITNAPAAATNAPAATDGIQLSFQGANIDMIVQWLSQTTGKSVLKHPQAQCQLTIVGGKKVSQREAINLVYRALSMEGFNAIESSSSILIVPEGREPKLNPELVAANQTEIPSGRQRLVKIFPLKASAAADVREIVQSHFVQGRPVERLVLPET